ncbi:MAG: hypothetical protein D6800_06660 [Candidatus Zixiibacteriota bacterium]|nr:MAG: hypothetical protein D6800_06660 [candidate division Zixibacteria bacterium]
MIESRREQAKRLFDRLKSLSEKEIDLKLHLVAAELGIEYEDAFQWVYVTRPVSVSHGGNWPYDEDEDEPVADQDPYDLIPQVSLAEPLELESGTYDLSPEEIESVQSLGRVVRLGRRVVYDSRTDMYIVTLPRRTAPYLVPRKLHEEAQRAYSNADGRPVSASQVARMLGLTPSEFVSYRTAFRWRRDMLPLSAVEMSRLSPQEAAERVLEVKERAVRDLLEDAQQKQDADDAKKWRNFKAAALDYLRESVSDVFRLEPENIRPILTTSRYPTARLIIPLNDWQVGSFASKKSLRLGDDFNADVFREMIKLYQEELIRYVQHLRVDWGAPYVVLLGDLFHGLTGETVHKTQLAHSMREMGKQQLDITLDALRQICDTIVELFGPIHLISLPGNHEGWAAQFLGYVLKERYEHIRGCSFHISDSRTYHTLIDGSYYTFDHGASPESGVRGGKLARGGAKLHDQVKALVMARPDLLAEARRQRGGVYFVMGDQHHTLDESSTGVEIIKLPALPSGDLYADENLWYSRPAQAILYHTPSGLGHMHRIYLDHVFKEDR